MKDKLAKEGLLKVFTVKDVSELQDLSYISGFEACLKAIVGCKSDEREYYEELIAKYGNGLNILKITEADIFTAEEYIKRISV